MKPEGGVVTTRAGIAFVECVTVALPTEHISPELSPGIYIQYIIKNGVRRIHIDVLHFLYRAVLSHFLPEQSQCRAAVAIKISPCRWDVPNFKNLIIAHTGDD